MEPQETYLKIVCKQLQGPRREKEMFLHELREDIEFFLEQNLDATYNDIETNFGSPEDMAQEFTNSLEPQAAESFLRIKRGFFLVGTLAIVLALIIVGFMVVDYIEWKHFTNGYYVETIIVPSDYENLPEKPKESTDMILVYK